MENESKRANVDILNVGQNLYKGKVESKLHVETKAMQEKKREKFDAKNDSKQDANTFGGRLPNMQVRAVPEWRQGI